MMDQHREAYRDEARELLAELEGALLELEQRPTDGELIGRIFRQLHTVKGSGAMFGFDEIASFTHEIETVYDRVREGALAVTPRLIGLTLQARDHIVAMLDANGPQDEAGREATLAGFRAFAAAPEDEVRPEPQRAVEAAEEEAIYHIRFRPPEDAFLRGVNLGALLAELRGMGTCTVVAAIDGIPELERLDPELCYLRWDIVLTTAQSEDAVRDVFIFVEDGAEISIERVKAEKKRPLGEILVDSGRAAQADVRAALAEQEHVATTLRKTDAGGASIRVAAEKIDGLMNVVGELVTVDARVTQLAASSGDPELLFVAEELERLTQKLRDSAMGMRMLPIGSSFGRLRRLVHDLGRELGKDVEMVTEGGETELDKTVIEQMNDVFVHVIRNAIDHGIEPAAQRIAAGKPVRGTIRISAVHSGVHVLLRVEDDGAGLDAERIYAKAVEKGLIAAGTELSEQEIYALVLQPGFSTADRVTEVSGRGVGMDVVYRVVSSLRGSVEISGRKGVGAAIALRLPLTLAIIDGLLVHVAGEHFVVPQANVIECMEAQRHEIDRGGRRTLVALRGELIPYVDLRRHFRLGGEMPPLVQVMIAEGQRGRFGIVVDRVIGDHQTVIKPLGRLYGGAGVFSGATILGDGSVVLVLDVERLRAEAAGEMGAAA